MKCLLKYRWVKLPRAQLPQGKGVLGYWSRLAARAAFRKGTACYCGYHNEVVPGMWSGGIVGLKSILGVRRRAQALQIMDQLQSLGYIKYSLDQKTKRLDYQICDWVISCSGQGCSAGTVYATDGYGFLCLPRNITQRLVKHNYKFEEADALLDLWCHTTWQDTFILQVHFPNGKRRLFLWKYRHERASNQYIKNEKVRGCLVPFLYYAHTQRHHIP